MGLGNLYMALMLVRVNNGILKASSAGMPPFYIYRQNKQTVEEFICKGMPLGAVASFEYRTFETRLEKGVTVLLMSDRFPEHFNYKGEMLDYSRVKEKFIETAQQSANDIIDHLFRAAESWRNGRDQHDDVTFIAFKCG